MGQIYELNFCKGELTPIETNDKALNLNRGDVIHWGGNMGYPEEDLIILEKVKGFEDRTNYKVVNMKHSFQPMEEYTPYIKTVEAYSIKDPNDKNSYWHTQHHFLTNKKVTEKEIKEILNFIPIAEQRNKDKKEAEIKAIKDAGQLTQTEKISLSTKEISKLIRDKLKKKFPKCKFSVTKQSYSGGSSITIKLMEAPFKAFRKFEELSKEAIQRYLDDGRRTEQELKNLCNEKYAQLNQYTAKEEYDPNKWNNGHFLTQEAYTVLKEAVNIANYYNYDNSNPMTDYYDVNFSFHLQIGEWNKPFKQNGTK